jgi:hypothetical protein
VAYLPEAGGFVINPTAAQMAASKLDLLMAGTAEAVLMIEGFCDWLTEEQMLQVITGRQGGRGQQIAVGIPGGWGGAGGGGCGWCCRQWRGCWASCCRNQARADRAVEGLGGLGFRR